jgi:hypothetical protein
MIYRLSEFGTAPAAEESKRQNAAQLLFLSCLHSEKEVGTQVFLVTMSRLSLRTVALPPCLPLYIKDLLKEDAKGFLMGIFDWLPLTLLLAVGSLPKQLSALRTLYTGFRKAKLKKS